MGMSVGWDEEVEANETCGCVYGRGLGGLGAPIVRASDFAQSLLAKAGGFVAIASGIWAAVSGAPWLVPAGLCLFGFVLLAVWQWHRDIVRWLLRRKAWRRQRSTVHGEYKLSIDWDTQKKPDTLNIIAINDTSMPIENCTIWLLEIARWSTGDRRWEGPIDEPPTIVVSRATVPCKSFRSESDNFKLLKATDKYFGYVGFIRHWRYAAPGTWKARILAEFDDPNITGEVIRKYTQKRLCFSYDPQRPQKLRVEDDPEYAYRDLAALLPPRGQR